MVGIFLKVDFLVCCKWQESGVRRPDFLSCTVANSVCGASHLPFWLSFLIYKMSQLS